MEPWQMYSGGSLAWPAFWLDEQCVFTDSIYEHMTGGRNGAPIGYMDPAGTDISKLYLACTSDYIYGSIQLEELGTLQDGIYTYAIYLSGLPNDHDAPNAVKFEISVDNQYTYGTMYHSLGGFWQYQSEFFVLQFGNAVEFRVAFSDIPIAISGRYLSVESSCGHIGLIDENHTHIQIGATGTIDGRVDFKGHLGGPVFVQAFTKLDEPEESIVATTMLQRPGNFRLEGLSLGAEIFVRAFSPMFGDYHPLDMDALKAESTTSVIMRTQTVNNVNLNLQLPYVLNTPSNVPPPVVGYIDGFTKSVEYFAFDAIAGFTYRIGLSRFEGDSQLMLLDRNGNSELMEIPYWQNEPLYWQCPVNGRYYVRVSEPEWYHIGAQFWVTVSTDYSCPLVDISSSQWIGVRDCQVDLNDFALLASEWLSNCDEPYWCHDSDYDYNHNVDTADLMRLINEWMQTEYTN